MRAGAGCFRGSCWAGAQAEAGTGAGGWAGLGLGLGLGLAALKRKLVYRKWKGCVPTRQRRPTATSNFYLFLS